jgi:hypothetical protein
MQVQLSSPATADRSSARRHLDVEISGDSYQDIVVWCRYRIRDPVQLSTPYRVSRWRRGRTSIPDADVRIRDGVSPAELPPIVDPADPPARMSPGGKRSALPPGRRICTHISFPSTTSLPDPRQAVLARPAQIRSRPPRPRLCLLHASHDDVTPLGATGHVAAVCAQYV